MRILIVTETYPPNVNGAALATERIAQELAADGNNVFVAAPSTSFKHYRRKQGPLVIYRLRSILIQRKQDFRISPTPLHAKEFRAIMKEVAPDIIHINNPGFLAQTAISVAREYGVPVIGTSHFMPENLTHYLHLPDQLEKKINTGIWKFYAKFYSRLNLIICPTQTGAELLNRLHVGTKIKVISNGIDLKKFSPKNPGGYLKERYKLKNKTTMLFVGRLDKEKNLHILLEALSFIKNKADFQMVIVGKGKEEEALKEQTRELGLADRVIFTGYLPKPDLPNIYKVGDIFIMPSNAELQSLVTMEAMACGLPVVGADAVALPHLVKDGKNGFLFRPSDSHDLAEKILIMLNDEKMRQRMAQASLEIIKEHDIKKILQMTEEAYREVIATHVPVLEEEDAAGNGKKVLKKLKKINLKKIITTDFLL
jgi:1,2-diacylglycerol 3-alpha-glucosyltransferase